jgi:hypothetical protein
MADRISVVLPTRNRSSLLRQALRCAQSQTWRDVEVIVVDEGSTDETPRILADEFAGVRRIQHETAQGPSVARNAGVAAATGDWVFFLDDDDLIHPRHLEELLQASKTAPSRSLVTGRMRNFAVMSGEIVLGPIICAPEERSDVATLNELVDPRRQRTITLSSVLWPRRLFDRVSWDPELSFSEDCDLFVRSVLDGWHFVGCQVGKFYIRLHPGARVTTTMDPRRQRSPALAWSNWADLIKLRPEFAGCGPALRDGLMAQLTAAALRPEAQALAPRLERAFRDWGGRSHYLLNPPGNRFKKALLETILRAGGPATLERFLAVVARLSPRPPSYVEGFTPPQTDVDRDDAATIRRFVA